MIISMQKKHLKKFNTLHDKTLDKLGTEENYFNTIKVIDEKSTVNIMSHVGEKLKTFPLR